MSEHYTIPGVDEEKYDPQKIQENELMDFSRKNKISGDELELAYKLAMGVADEKEEGRKEVFALGKKMEEFMNNGLAVNRIVEMIGSKREYESACDNYYELVGTMPISEREKDVLISIVKKKRAGKLTITDKKNRKEYGIKITERVAKSSANDLAIELMDCIELLEGSDKIEISFAS